MRVVIPHNLGKATARERLRTNSHNMGSHIRGGIGQVEIEDTQVVFNMILPPALSFVEPLVQGAIKQTGQQLLAPPSGS
jgi:hypothetical protein